MRSRLWPLIFLSSMVLSAWVGHAETDFKQDQFLKMAEKIHSEAAIDWPVQNNGRRKPFQSLARESLLFVSGKYGMWGLSPTAFYLGLTMYPEASDLQIIEVRSPDLREQMGFPRDKRYFSINELRKSSLMTLAEPLVEKQRTNKRSLSEIENKTLDTAQQAFLADAIIQGSHLLEALGQPPMDGQHGGAMGNASPVSLDAFMRSLHGDNQEEQLKESNLVKMTLMSQFPAEEREPTLDKISKELLYNRFHPFLWAAWMSLLVSVLFLAQSKKKVLPFAALVGVSIIPLALELIGFYLRITITGFAPVTNMYGTMLWVSFGVGFFALLLFAIYKHLLLSALLNLGVFLLLLLTQSIPLVLSPDMDPIVAVLRSNFWLTIHVLTITISYAAFTIAMLIGNTAIIRYLLGKADETFIKTYSHFTYRVIQLGVFLLTAGIILGGVWADYSWGRFWGWDPKETWALIADLGYLVLLHARFVGWLGSFGVMIFSPIAYLLVVMAWYGVNFILAAGLHSYGFSSGGAMAVAIFVGVQLVLFVAAFVKSRLASTKTV